MIASIPGDKSTREAPSVCHSLQEPGGFKHTDGPAHPRDLRQSEHLRTASGPAAGRFQRNTWALIWHLTPFISLFSFRLLLFFGFWTYTVLLPRFRVGRGCGVFGGGHCWHTVRPGGAYFPGGDRSSLWHLPGTTQRLGPVPACPVLLLRCPPLFQPPQRYCQGQKTNNLIGPCDNHQPHHHWLIDQRAKSAYWWHLPFFFPDTDGTLSSKRCC